MGINLVILGTNTVIFCASMDILEINMVIFGGKIALFLADPPDKLYN